MTTRWLNALFTTRPELRPTRALLTPAWLGALAVLGLNDHLFKGAGVLPGGLTGKLSDVAGMIVAPALLAALLGVKSRRGLLYCHIAVGLVFSLINVSPACADAWSWLMGLVGFPWAITVDPTDLLTLPALALGWAALVPAMRAPAAPALTWRPRPAEAGAAALGTLLCVATSRGDEGGEFSDEGWDAPPVDTGWDTGSEPGWYEPINADVYLHNSSPDQTVSVRVRELRDDVLIDCFNVEKNPGVLFSEPLFDQGITWTLPPRTNAPVRQLGTHIARDCYAALVSSDTLDPTILFWKAGDIPEQQVEGSHTSPDAYMAGAVVLGVDADGVASIVDSSRDIVFPRAAPAADAILPQPDVTRIAWSDPPTGIHQITELDVGADGCAAFTFDGGVAGPRFYLCTPLTELPFVVDQWVNVQDLGDTLSIRLAAAPGDQNPVPDVQLAASRGQYLPNFADFTIAAKPLFLDNLGPDPICGTVAQPQEISLDFGGQVSELLGGQSVTLDDGANTLVVHAAHAERRIILDPVCAEGPDALGDDLEIVAVWSPSMP